MYVFIHNLVFIFFVITHLTSCQPTTHKPIKHIPKKNFQSFNMHILAKQAIRAYFLYKNLTFNNACVKYASDSTFNFQETDYILKRKQLAQQTLTTIYHCPIALHHTPTIGIAFSGGGLRAFFSACGFLTQLDNMGLLDTLGYCASLSGSTWAIASWIASHQSIENFSKTIIPHLANGMRPAHHPSEIKQILELLLKKIACDQPYSIIDIYGAFLSMNFLAPWHQKPITETLCHTHRNLNAQFHPLPLYTSIVPLDKAYYWLEINPFACKYTECDYSIPTCALGRHFNQGTTITSDYELSLGYLMGIWGSAFSVNACDGIYLHKQKLQAISEKLPKILRYILKPIIKMFAHSPIGKKRPFAAHVHNPFYAFAPHSIFCKPKTIEILDAGIDFNIPLPPLISRPLDLLIIYDTSTDITDAPALTKALIYCQNHGYNLPPIDLSLIDRRVISVFKSKKPGSPTIIYYPRTKNIKFDPFFDPNYQTQQGFAHTFNFSYKEEEAWKLFTFAAFVAKETKNLLQKVIYEVIQIKKGTQSHMRNIKKPSLLSMSTLEEQFEKQHQN